MTVYENLYSRKEVKNPTFYTCRIWPDAMKQTCRWRAVEQDRKFDWPTVHNYPQSFCPEPQSPLSPYNYPLRRYSFAKSVQKASSLPVYPDSLSYKELISSWYHQWWYLSGRSQWRKSFPEEVHRDRATIAWDKFSFEQDLPRHQGQQRHGSGRRRYGNSIWWDPDRPYPWWRRAWECKDM